MSPDSASIATAFNHSARRQSTLNYKIDSHSSKIIKLAECSEIDEYELISCENNLTRSNNNLKPVSKMTLKRYIFKHVEQVGENIFVKEMSGSVYALVFDRWSAGSIHFLSFILCFQVNRYAPIHRRNSFLYHLCFTKQNLLLKSYRNSLQRH